MDLDPKQREAVEHGEGPLLIVAGPGSGKTATLVRRVASLVCERGVAPDKILVTTFTKKAADEMLQRLRGLIGEDADGLWLGTVHSRCLEVLRQKGNAPLVGLQDAFTIADTGDTEKAVDRLVKAEALRYIQSAQKLDEEDIPSKDIVGAIIELGLEAMPSRISYAKEQNVGPNDVVKVYGWPPVAAQVYREYNEALHQSNRVDFGDMQMLTVQVLRDVPSALAWIQRRFQYVLVDEYQDTNAVQAELFRLICEHHRNITVVGDVDQAVYSWRGASPDIMLNFAQGWPGAKTVYLDRNYRSTQAIVMAAQAVIRNNRSRFSDFKPEAVQAGGEVPCAIHTRNSDTEALYVADKIDQLVRTRTTPFHQIAVLYRSHRQSRAVEQALLRKQVPHMVLGGTPYFARREIQDLLAWLRLLVNPRDDDSFRRAIMAPPRGVGNVTLNRLESLDRPLLESAADLALDNTMARKLRIQPKQRRGLTEVAELCASMAWALPEKTLLGTLASETGYLAFLSTQDDGAMRAENVAELCSLYAGFDEMCGVRREGTGTPKDRPIAFLDWAATELQNTRQQRSRVATDANVVTLMSMHAAKGSEFDAVFVVGCTDGMIPAYFAIKSDEDDPLGGKEEGVEEERRLFYVAMTRARKLLRLIVPEERRGKLGNWIPSEPSRFLYEAGRTIRWTEAR